MLRTKMPARRAPGVSGPSWISAGATQIRGNILATSRSPLPASPRGMPLGAGPPCERWLAFRLEPAHDRGPELGRFGVEGQGLWTRRAATPRVQRPAGFARGAHNPGPRAPITSGNSCSSPPPARLDRLRPRRRAWAGSRARAFRRGTAIRVRRAVRSGRRTAGLDGHEHDGERTAD